MIEIRIDTNNSNDILSVIGCATGLFSLIITVIQLWKSKPKLEFEFAKDNCYFEKLSSMSESFGTHQALVRLITINKSSSPITIYKIEATSKGKYLPWISPRSNEIEIIEKTALGEQRTKFYTSSKYSIPIIIEPYGVFDGFIFLPHLESPTGDVPLQLKITSSSKTFKTSTAIQSFSKRNKEANRLQKWLDK